MLEGVQSVVGGSRMSNVLKPPMPSVPPTMTAAQHATPAFVKPAPSHVWTSLAEFQAQLPLLQHMTLTPIAHIHPSVKQPVKKEVDPSKIHPHDSVSNVTPREGETPMRRHSWGERPKTKRALECSMESTKHIEGKRLETFIEVDPSVLEIREFERLESTKQWEKLCDQFIKYTSLNCEIMWEGKPDVTALTE